LDHKWGRNVYTYGFGSLGATLVARFWSETWFNWVYITNAQGWPPWWWLIPLDTGLANPYTVVGVAGVEGNFPYGLPVEADGPA
jgi:hypothetical protein